MDDAQRVNGCECAQQLLKVVPGPHHRHARQAMSSRDPRAPCQVPCNHCLEGLAVDVLDRQYERALVFEKVTVRDDVRMGNTAQGFRFAEQQVGQRLRGRSFPSSARLSASEAPSRATGSGPAALNLASGRVKHPRSPDDARAALTDSLIDDDTFVPPIDRDTGRDVLSAGLERATPRAHTLLRRERATHDALGAREPSGVVTPDSDSRQGECALCFFSTPRKIRSDRAWPPCIQDLR